MTNEWQENTTGECPVDSNVLVDVVLENDDEYTEEAGWFYWTKGTTESTDQDVVKWRLHKAEPPRKEGSSLQEALNNSLADKSDEYFKQPESKYKPRIKLYLQKTPEMIVSEIVSRISDKDISEKDVKNIFKLYNCVVEAKESYE